MRYSLIYIVLILAMIASIVMLVLTLETKKLWTPTKALSIISGQAIVESAKFSWDRNISSVNAAGLTIFPSLKQYDGVSYNLVYVPYDKYPDNGYPPDSYIHESGVEWREYPKLTDKRTTILVRVQNETTFSFIDSFIAEFNHTPEGDKLAIQVGFALPFMYQVKCIQHVGETNVELSVPVVLNATPTPSGLKYTDRNGVTTPYMCFSGVMSYSFDGRNPLTYVNGHPINFETNTNVPVMKGNTMLDIIDSYWTKVYVFDRCLSDEEQAAVNSYLTTTYIKPNPISYTKNDIPIANIDAIVNEPIPTYKCIFKTPGIFKYTGSLLGLDFNAETGVINGTPKVIGTSNLQVQCTTQNQTTSVTSLTINVKPLTSFPNKDIYTIMTSIVLGVSIIMLIILSTHHAKSRSKRR
jgi:hypothetical protein